MGYNCATLNICSFSLLIATFVGVAFLELVTISLPDIKADSGSETLYLVL